MARLKGGNDMTCTTHHDACACREAAHAAEIATLSAEVIAFCEELEVLTNKYRRAP